jgi:hypothetical protein
MQQRFDRSGRFLIASLMTLVMGLILSGTLSAQNTEEFDFDDIPVDDAGQYYVAIGGGYLGMIPFMKFDELNKLSGSLGLGTFDGPLLLNGGGGLASILVVPNVRLGVFGAGGSRLVEADVVDNNVTYKRSLRYGASVTAAQIDYAIRLVGSLTVLPGVMVGAGSQSLELTQTRVDSAGFGGIFTPTPGPDANHYGRITNSYFFYYPAVNFEYAFTKFMMFRAGVGYAGSAWAGKWADGAGAEIKGVPDIKPNGVSIQFGLFVGLFQNM